MSGDFVTDSVKTFRRILAKKDLLSTSQDNADTLLRFLVSTKYDIAMAVNNWEVMIKWRKENGADTIIQDYSENEYEHMSSYFPHGCHGVDKKGGLVLIECVGKANTSKLNEADMTRRFLRFHIHNIEKVIAEKLPACPRIAHKPIRSMTRIADYEGLEPGCTIDFYIRAIMMETDYYPETMHQMFVINAGKWRTMKYALSKIFTPWKTHPRLHLLNKNYKDTLLEVIDEDQLPVFLGGSCLCLEEGGCLGSDKGPWKKDLGTAATHELVIDDEQTVQAATHELVIDDEQTVQAATHELVIDEEQTVQAATHELVIDDEQTATSLLSVQAATHELVLDDEQTAIDDAEEVDVPMLRRHNMTTIDARRDELNNVEVWEKLCRAIQYGSKFWSNGQPGAAQNVDKLTSFARKVFRLFKFVDYLHALMIPIPKETSLPLKLLGKMQNAMFSTFLLFDQIVLLGRRDIIKNEEQAVMIGRISLYCWMASSVCSTLVELGRFSAQMNKLGRELNGSEKHKNEQYKLKMSTLGLIKAAGDIVVAVGLLQLAPKKVTPRLTGAFGFATSLISCYQLLLARTKPHLTSLHSAR